MHQLVMCLERLDHAVVRLEHVLTFKQRRALDIFSVATDRVIHLEVITLPDHIVILTVTGCGMHGAGTRFQGDVLAADDRHFAIVEGML